MNINDYFSTTAFRELSFESMVMVIIEHNKKLGYSSVVSHISANIENMTKSDHFSNDFNLIY